MEIIKWLVSDSEKSGQGVDRNNCTYNALIRLDELDKELLSPEVISWIRNEHAKYCAENNVRPKSNGLELRVSEDSESAFQDSLMYVFCKITTGKELHEYCHTF